MLAVHQTEAHAPSVSDQSICTVFVSSSSHGLSVIDMVVTRVGERLLGATQRCIHGLTGETSAEEKKKKSSKKSKSKVPSVIMSGTDGSLPNMHGAGKPGQPQDVQKPTDEAQNVEAGPAIVVEPDKDGSSNITAELSGEPSHRLDETDQHNVLPHKQKADSMKCQRLADLLAQNSSLK